MARLLHRPGPKVDGQKVFLATPTYGDVSPGYAYALFASSAALSQAGIASELAIFYGDCHVDDARNRLVRDFLETDCTDLVFLDSDIRWEPKDLVDLCQFDRDVVASIYPFKVDDGGFPLRFIEGEIWADQDGLIEVDGVPTGFLRIKRHVLSTLALAAVHFKPKTDDKCKIPLIFERTVQDGARWGGDYTFCRKWRDTGGKIYVNPEACFEHIGTKEWRGSLGHYQRCLAHGPIKAGLLEIKHGIETDQTFNTLVEAWDNHFSVGADLLSVAVALARKANGPVLETGSGITTLAMAATGAKVHSLEHDPSWAVKVRKTAKENGLNLHLHSVDMIDGWYDLTRCNMPDSFALVLCDGPQRNYDRSQLWRVLGDQIKDAVWIKDDCCDLKELEAFEADCRVADRPYKILGKPNARQFGVSAVA